MSMIRSGVSTGDAVMDKRGEEIVEATIVLPVIILSILSMIMLMIFFFACLNTQMTVHQQLVEKALNSRSVMKVGTSEEYVSRGTGGVVTMILNKKVKGRCYLINEAEAIRLGEAVDGKAE